MKPISARPMTLKASAPARPLASSSSKNRPNTPVQAVAALKPWIQAECARAVLKEAEQKPLETMSRSEAEEFGKRLVASHKVDIRIAGMHGSAGEYVIRADVAVDGKAPPGKNNPRYYKMKYSAIIGWTYDRESDAVSYWLNLL